MLAQWVYHGQDPRHFWDCTHREAHVVLGAASRRDERLAWLNAAYSIPAHHDPEKMGEMPSLQKAEAKKEPSEQEREAESIAARAVMKAWAKRGQNG